MSTETVEAPEVPLSEYQDKKVKVVFRRPADTTDTEMVGKVEVANDIALLVRQRGHTMGDLIEAEWISSIGLDDTKPRELKQKTLKDPNFDTVRAHLADRHAWLLEDVNNLGEEEAFKVHRELDHSKLSHTHEFILDAEDAADGEEPDDDDLLGDDEDDDGDDED